MSASAEHIGRIREANLTTAQRQLGAELVGELSGLVHPDLAQEALSLDPTTFEAAVAVMRGFRDKIPDGLRSLPGSVVEGITRMVGHAADNIEERRNGFRSVMDGLESHFPGFGRLSAGEREARLRQSVVPQLIQWGLSVYRGDGSVGSNNT